MIVIMIVIVSMDLTKDQGCSLLHYVVSHYHSDDHFAENESPRYVVKGTTAIHNFQF